MKGSDKKVENRPIGDYSMKEATNRENGMSTKDEQQEAGKDEEKEEDEATFLKLLQRNRCFRLYMMSYVITHMGEWLTYIASIALAEELLGSEGTSSRTTISILVVVRLLPNVLLSVLGGILADGRDRRESMIVLDVLGAISPLLFLVAVHFQSIGVIYLVTFIQQCISGLYEPCRSAIIPQLVPEEAYLKKATTLAGLAWSVFACIGSTLGGIVLTYFGLKACFFLDSATYLASAYLMYLVGGTWNVADQNDGKVFESVFHQIKGMTIDGARYLRGSFFGPLVLLKASGGLVYGAADVLNVGFSEPRGVSDKNSPMRLGILFGAMGLGCTIGPLIADQMTDMKQPKSLQKACIFAIALEALGFFGFWFLDQFSFIFFFTLVRTAGASINWIDSSILLQKFSNDEMMGRVLAVDFGLALLAEATSAYLAGFLQDRMHLSVSEVSLVLASMGMVLSMLWLLYYLAGKGAAAAPSTDNNRQCTTSGETTPLVFRDKTNASDGC